MRSLIDIVDFSVDEIQQLLETACDISEHPEKYADWFESFNNEKMEKNRKMNTFGYDLKIFERLGCFEDEYRMTKFQVCLPVWRMELLQFCSSSFSASHGCGRPVTCTSPRSVMRNTVRTCAPFAR